MFTLDHTKWVASLAALACCGLAQAGPVGTAFTYQGNLTEGAGLANGQYEFQVTLFPASNALSPVPGTSPVNATVTVIDGLFTVPLDFGPEAFDGEERWLEITVQPVGAESVPQILSPRQRLTAAPHATHAAIAEGVMLPFEGQGASAEPLIKMVNSNGPAIWAEAVNATAFFGVSDSGGPAFFAANSGGGPAAVFTGGNVGIGTQTPASPLTVNGTIESKQLQLNGGTDASVSGGGFARLGPVNGENVLIDNDEIMAINTGVPSALALNADGGDVVIGGTGEANVGVGTSSPTEAVHLSRPWSKVGTRLETVRYQPVSPTSADLYPTQVAEMFSGQPWTNPQQSMGADDQYAYVSLTESSSGPDADVSRTLELTNLGFSIPDSATITGITVYGWGSYFGNCAQCDDPNDPYDGPQTEIVFQLVSEGTVSPAVRSDELHEGSDAPVSGGSQSDLWGAAWTPQQVNSPSFGVRLAVNLQLIIWDNTGWGGHYEECTWCDGSALVFLDSLRIVVRYEPAPVTPMPINWTYGVPEDQTFFAVAPTADLSNPVMKVQSNGTVSVTNLVETSSRRFKTNVRPLTEALDTVERLQGVSYQWDARHGGGKDIGFIAEEVASVVPEIVAMEPDGVNATGLKYDRIGALAVEAIKEMHKLVRDQQSQIESLRAELARLRECSDADKPEPGESNGLCSDHPCDFAD